MERVYGLGRRDGEMRVLDPKPRLLFRRLIILVPMTDDTLPFGSLEPQNLGHYRLVRKLAEGGMGEVFLAEDMRLHRMAAVKVISRDVAQDPVIKRRFLREAHAASKLNHPNIAVIYDVGETADGVSFIGMEYVDGPTLAAAMRERLPVDSLIEFAIQIVDAVADAHRLGIIHRDLKPQNVMITSRNAIKVLDFGLAKLTDAIPKENDATSSALTGSGAIMGTLSYMSPEQARGRQIDHRSDIFSLGVILYQMATGHLPFSGDSAFETLEKIVRADPEPIPKWNPDIPAELVRIVGKCLEKDRDRRFSSAGELLSDLRGVRATSRSGAVLPARRSLWWAGVAATLVAVLFFIALRTRSTPSAPEAPLVSQKPRPHVDAATKAVAVLPFKSLSSDPESESFGDGMTEELINALGNVKGLRVASRSSSFAFKGANIDVRDVAERLRVGSVVEGSIRKAGDQIRVAVQLVDAADGYQRWSQTFDRKLTDVFAIQDEIARAVAERIRAGSSSDVIPPPTTNFEAYRAFVMGRHLVAKDSIENLERAVVSLNDALRLDPNLAPAYVELARAYRLLVVRTGMSPEDGFPKAIDAAERALRIDSRLDTAHAVLSDIYRSQLRWREAEQHLRQAIGLQVNSPDAHRSHSSLLLHLGRFDEAINAARKAYELDAANAAALGRALYHARAFSEALPWLQKALERTPESAVVHFYIGMTFAHLNRFPEAVTTMNRAIELAGDQRWRTHLAHVYALAGDRQQAEHLVKDVMAKTPEKNYPRPDFAAVYAVLGDKERALTWLESAYEARPSDLTEMKAEPDFITLRSEPRFQRLASRLGLPK